MKRNRGSDLERRLEEWAGEYGGSRYENIGWPGASALASAMKYCGRSPEGLAQTPYRQKTPADDVEESVRALEAQIGGYMPARVIRLEYTARSLPIEQKIWRMARIGGAGMTRVRYYQHLRLARVHVAGWLRLPFSDEDAPEEKKLAEALL